MDLDSDHRTPVGPSRSERFRISLRYTSVKTLDPFLILELSQKRQAHK